MPELDSGSMEVLHVDDDELFLDMAKEMLESADESLSVRTESDVSLALDIVQDDSEPINCIVSDYNMPAFDGIEFLKRVRADYPDLPFILYTGKGSEEIASEAISAGVTDYLQKDRGKEQFAVLANRIRNTVEQHLAVKEVEETREFYSRVLERSWDYVIIVDPNGIIDYVSPAVERTMGYPPDELIGQNSLDFPHPDDREFAMEALSEVIMNPDSEVTVEYRTQHADGSWRWIEVRGGNLLEDPIIEGIMVNVRDITERKQNEQELERKTERLEELTRFMSHDVSNQLMIADGHLELAKADSEDEYIEQARTTIDRVEEMIDKIRQLARSGSVDPDLEPLAIESLAVRSWEAVRTPDAELNVNIDMTVTADLERMRQLFENLFRNAIQHGGTGISVSVGELTDDGVEGFYVEDDGPGFETEDPDEVFDSSFSTIDSGTGLGLTIVQQIVDLHGWEIDAGTASKGGARFEITGVDPESTNA